MSLYTFNFKQLPCGVLWMFILIFLIEICIHIFWTPVLIGENIFTKLAPSYDYGYGDNEKIFYLKEGKLACFPTQYADYRKQSLGVTKKQNELRIFIYGGSVSRGPEQKNYPNLLEKILNEDYCNASWKVINFSSQGYGSTRMLLLLRKTISYKPDLLVLHIHGSNEYEDERDFKYINKVNSGMGKVLFQSHFIVILKKVYDKKFTLKMNDMEPNAEDEISASRDSINLNRWLKSIDKNLKQMIEIAQQNNIPVILLGRTMRNFGNDEFETKRTSDINNVIRYYSSMANIYYFDTQKKVEDNYPILEMRSHFFEDLSHWTLEGHNLIANQIAVEIRNKRLCPN